MRTFKDPIKDLGKYLYEISYRIFKILASRILQRFFNMWREVHHMFKFAVCMFLCWTVVLQYLDQCHGLPLLKRYQFSCWTTTAKEIGISFKFILHLKHLYFFKGGGDWRLKSPYKFLFLEGRVCSNLIQYIACTL